MTKLTPETASAPINVLLMLKDHLAGRYREVHGELARLRTREHDLREELSRIERHAAIESIPLPNLNAPDLPKVEPPKAEPKTEESA